MLRRKLGEVGLNSQVKLHVVQPGGTIDLAPFALRFVRMSHSIPESQALIIETPCGIVVHTGDWKLDPQPLIGPPSDEAALAAIGEKGVLALVCDSTNALQQGRSGSEAKVRESAHGIGRARRT